MTEPIESGTRAPEAVREIIREWANERDVSPDELIEFIESIASRAVFEFCASFGGSAIELATTIKSIECAYNTMAAMSEGGDMPHMILNKSMLMALVGMSDAVLDHVSGATDYEEATVEIIPDKGSMN